MTSSWRASEYHSATGDAGVVRRVARWTRRLTLVAFVALASSASAAPLLPDLVADAPGPGKQPQLYTDTDGTQRLLLRLNGFVHNSGSGALEIRGSGPSAGSMTSVRQRVFDSSGPFADRASSARLWFETTDMHNHWHLMDAMRYSLWSGDRSVEVAPAQKVGFCLQDSQRIEANGPAAAVYPAPGGDFCGQGQPARPEVAMGVSAGWRDVYSAALPFQWVDISDTPPGTYWLRADADPDGVIDESDEANVPTYAAAPSVVNGYLAQPVDAGSVAADGSAAIDLQAAKFDDDFPGTPGPLQFEIVTAPASGSLDKPAGVWFSGSQVHYTPSPGQSGPVAFTFAARDATSAYPRNPPAATVTLTVAGGLPGPGPVAQPGALAISGAPASVPTSSVTQLTATGPEASAGVSWSVDGVAGGSPQLGEVSPDGVYRAPASPPPGGAVTIGAESISGATAAVGIRVVQAPAAKAAPSSEVPAAHGRLSRLVLARQRRTLIALVVPGRHGRLRFVARRGGRRIGSCSMVGQANVGAVCSMKLSRVIAPDPFVCTVPKTKHLKLPGVSVRVTLSYGKQHVVRSARTR
jgi:hypothetical protein